MSGISSLFGGGHKERVRVQVIDYDKQRREAEAAREEAEAKEAERLRKKKGARATIVAGDDTAAAEILRQTLGGA